MVRSVSSGELDIPYVKGPEEDGDIYATDQKRLE